MTDLIVPPSAATQSAPGNVCVEADTKNHGQGPQFGANPRPPSEGPREVELKLQLRPGDRAILEASGAFTDNAAKNVHQVTTYFDTADNALSKRGLILRIRKCDGSRIQTVKSRSNRRGLAVSRREWEWPIATDDPDLSPIEQATGLSKVAGILRGRLVPKFVTDIRRTTHLLHLENATIVEVAFDEGRIQSGTSSEVVNELELELKGGSPGPMYQLAKRLQILVPMWISSESKSARGWHVRTGQTEGGTEARVPKLKRRGSAAEGFCEIISGTLGHLTSNIAPALRGDPEGVHQMRSALRASRAALELFKPRLERAVFNRFDAELQDYGRIFGTARDWDVFCLLTLPAAMADLPSERFWDLRQAAEVERQVAYAAVADAVRGRDFTATIIGLAAWTDTETARPLPFGDKRMGKRFTALAPALLDRVEKKAKKRGHHILKLSAVARHSLRKALDKLCDDLKSVTQIFPALELQKYRQKCEAVQAILGVANDAEVAQQLVQTLVTGNRPDLQAPADSMVQWSSERKHKALRGVKVALRGFRSEPAFWRQGAAGAG